MNRTPIQSKRDRDRLRSERGLQRKELLREIRKTVKAWRDGAGVEASMQRVADLMDGKAQ
ncbi:hypothetical protein IB279_02795 [Ensifer sp. ENS06]|uniref:hypothetical protein n=1 Tax=Ensifer sp. ENS06 TaxID=2769276 RepID=UPI001785D81A|nr:hypothetical protein [Ensifer sp. ENS06]MBD9621867.1 hypothetical protein [Ensifer sp. ENS06]